MINALAVIATIAVFVFTMAIFLMGHVYVAMAFLVTAGAIADGIRYLARTR